MPVVVTVADVIVVSLAVVPLFVDSVVGSIVTVVVPDPDVVDGGCVVKDADVASVEAVVPKV